MSVSLPDFHGYSNEVIADTIKSSLSTKLDINRFMTPDYSLSENLGMKKKIHKYTIADGSQVDDLSRGADNTHQVDAVFSVSEYEVGRTQGTIMYADDDVMTDSTLVDAKVRFLSESMVNDWTKKAIAEFNKSENICAITGYNLENFANMLSAYTSVYESTEGLFFLANQSLDAKLRKMLGDSLQYTEGYIKTGAIGTVLGVPVYLSKAVPAGIIFLATREAVTAFIKKDVNVEQDRNIGTKVNRIVASRYSVIALTDETKCVVCGAAQATAATITTAASTTVAGAATTGATVKVYVNGEYAGTGTASGSAYSVTVAALSSNDVVKVIAELEGYVASIATATVA